LATLLADDKPRPSTEEPLLSLAVDRPEAVRILLAAKEPVDATNSFGKTPLMTAAQFDDAESLALLLKAGAAVNLQTLLPQEIQGNDLETGRGAPCGKYFIKHGGRTALMYAAANANLAVIQQLMAAGADKALRDSTGLLALDYLQGRGPVEANPVLSKTDRATAAQLLRVP
jgi:ankyrin repeat protein